MHAQAAGAAFIGRPAETASGCSPAAPARQLRRRPQICSLACFLPWAGPPTGGPDAVAKICEVLGLDEAFLIVGGAIDSLQIVSNRKVDEILDDASADLAVTLGVTKERVRLRFDVLQSD
jgi:hypothetical protein